MAYKMEDLFTVFDLLQASLYASDPHANGMTTEQQDKPGLPSLTLSKELLTGSKQETVSESPSQKFTYEESILVTVLGENYQQFINQDTGEWEQDQQVINTF